MSALKKVKKRIVWINDFPRRFGGAEKYIESLVEATRNEFHNTLLYRFSETVCEEFVKDFDGVYPLVSLKAQLEDINPDIIYIHNIEDENIQKELNSLGYKTIRFIHDHKLLCPREHKYKLFSNNTCESKMGIECYTSCLCLNKSKSYFVQTPSSLRKKLDEVKKNTGVIVSSLYMKEQLRNEGFDLSLIHYWPLFSRFEKRRGSMNCQKKIIYMGSLLKGKGIDVLLNSLERMKSSAELVIITNKKGEEGISTPPNIKLRYLVSASDNEIENEISSARFTVVPSISPETFSLVGVESLLIGTPVIASNVGGIREWQESNKTGFLVSSNNTRELAEKMEQLLTDDLVWKDFKREIRDKDFFRFSLESYVHFFQNVVEVI